MPEISIKKELKGTGNDIAVLRIQGSIDAYNSEYVAEKIDEVIQSKIYKIIIDCSKLNFISSSGMGVFLSFEDDIEKRQGVLKFAGLSDKIKHVFDKVGLSEVFDSYTNTEQAIESI